jgi:YhcH/YjgK/YiaL family protein
MIYDSLSNLKTYSNLSTNFKLAIDYILENDFADLAPGKYELTNGIFYLVQTYETKPETEVKFESHKKFIDIQIIIGGDEIIDITSIKNLLRHTGYDTTKDIEFYLPGKEYTRIFLKTNEFGVFFPQDAHRPGIRLLTKNVKKLVFKVPV